MNSEGLLWHLLSIFRATSLTVESSFELLLQILAWAKLSADESLPLDLRLSENSKPTTPEQLLYSFTKLSEYPELGENKAAFENIAPVLSAVPSSVLIAAVDFALEAAQSMLLNDFNIPEELFISALPQESLFIPKEIIQVMFSLAGDLKGKTVYCPYDAFCLIARHVSEQGGKPSVETPWRSPIPWLISLLTASKVHTVIGDPLQKPAFLKEGKLQKFDTCIAFPPLGTRIDIQIVKGDIYNRFQEKTSSASVLAIRHIISQTYKKAIVAIPGSILFSRGAEHLLRKDLLLHGMIEAVINMPPALLPFTPIPFSILVLNIQGNLSTVRFLNGASEQFSIRDGRNRSKLVNWEALMETFQDGKDEGLTVDILVKDILKNDANLEVAQYLLPPEQKKINNLFGISTTQKLSALVEFIRPFKPLTQGDPEGITALEIGVSDFPDYGYIKVPKRQILLSSKVLNPKDKQSFLRAGDIIIAVKGSAGKIAIVPHDAPSAVSDAWVANQSCLIMRSKEKIDPRILFIYLQSDVGKTLLKSIISGATVPLIQLQQLKEMNIIVPTQGEAESIIKTFEEQVQTQAKIESLKKDLEHLSKVHWKIF